MIPYLLAGGAATVLGVDLSASALAAAAALFPPPGPLGNAPGVRLWQGDVVELPSFHGPFQGAFLNRVLGSVHDQACPPPPRPWGLGA